MDYSITKRAHTPTPGIYMGRPTATRDDDRDRYDRDRYDRYDDRDYGECVGGHQLELLWQVMLIVLICDLIS